MKPKTATTQPKTTKKPAASPEPKKGNNVVRFVLKDATPHEVFLTGGFNGWNPAAQPLKRNGDGTWSAEIQLPPGRHEYLFVADGTWRPDPETEAVPNPFGGVNSVVTVGAASNN
jgi:1,4-alpha-glucan branching enzyme